MSSRLTKWNKGPRCGSTEPSDRYARANSWVISHKADYSDYRAVPSKSHSKATRTNAFLNSAMGASLQLLKITIPA